MSSWGLHPEEAVRISPPLCPCFLFVFSLVFIVGGGVFAMVSWQVGYRPGVALLLSFLCYSGADAVAGRFICGGCNVWL